MFFTSHPAHSALSSFSFTVCGLNPSKLHPPLTAHTWAACFPAVTQSLLSLAPLPCMCRPELVHHYSSRLELDRVYCSLWNSLPVSHSVCLSCLPELKTCAERTLVFFWVASIVDDVSQRGDLDRWNSLSIWNFFVRINKDFVWCLFWFTHTTKKLTLWRCKVVFFFF